jgi:6-phosphogluconolactonase (cycloisomerase 2 family)
MLNRIFVAVVFATGITAFAATSSAGARRHEGARHDSHVVFVQTNQPGGNQIVVFDSGRDGRLTRAGTYSTGGNGGIAAPGTESDHLGSQGSLAYDPASGLLIAVNAGSNSVSTFLVHGDRLTLTGIVPSGGPFPVSIAVHDGLVYVLDAGEAGYVHGYRIDGARLRPLERSRRTLGLANTNPPFFLTSPGQVGFTPDGTHLLVTTKGSGSRIDVFALRPDGRLSESPVRNASATPVPFAFTFTPSGRLAVGEAGASDVSTYRVTSSGRVVDPKSQSDHQIALCWIQRVGRFYYVSNTGSNNLGGYRIADGGQPSLITPTGVVASTEPGPIDLTSPSDTRFLYADTGGGTVDEFRVGDDGTLTKLAVITGLPVGIQGIASK